MREIETIGIVGGGQLGRMLTTPAIELGYKVLALDPNYHPPAEAVGARCIQGSLTDEVALATLANYSDVVTWEIEHIGAGHLAELAAVGANVEPSPNMLQTIQDKYEQKRMLEKAGIPFGPYAIQPVADVLGGPYVVKSRKGGFDGRGNLVMEKIDQYKIDTFFGEQPVYFETKLDFDAELSVVAARDKIGNIATYPVVETIQEDNICNLVLSPAQVDPEVANEATEIARATLDQLDGAGVFAVEMFVLNNRVYVNEVAPRVHNSGHLTLKANATSQFEQHIRAITGMPLGSTERLAPAAAMINILGTQTGPMQREGLRDVLGIPGASVNYYGKTPRPARKIGHITVLGETVDDVRNKAQQARASLKI